MRLDGSWVWPPNVECKNIIDKQSPLKTWKLLIMYKSSLFCINTFYMSVFILFWKYIAVRLMYAISNTFDCSTQIYCWLFRIRSMMFDSIHDLVSGRLSSNCFDCVRLSSITSNWFEWCSIEFGNRTRKMLVVQLRSITEPNRTQSFDCVRAATPVLKSDNAPFQSQPKHQQSNLIGVLFYGPKIAQNCFKLHSPYKRIILGSLFIYLKFSDFVRLKFWGFWGKKIGKIAHNRSKLRWF